MSETTCRDCVFHQPIPAPEGPRPDDPKPSAWSVPVYYPGLIWDSDQRRARENIRCFFERQVVERSAAVPCRHFSADRML